MICIQITLPIQKLFLFSVEVHQWGIPGGGSERLDEIFDPYTGSTGDLQRHLAKLNIQLVH